MSSTTTSAPPTSTTSSASPTSSVTNTDSGSIFLTPSASPSPTFFPGPGGGGNGNGGGNGGGGNGFTTQNGSIATSASLYLYTFLATLVLLLSVSAAIVIRSFVLRRRHRLMVEEAIRNGTWVPPSPPSRAARVDLSKKPALWEVHLGGGGGGGGASASTFGKGGTSTNWMLENPTDWESIKPFSADYIVPGSTPLPSSNSQANLSSSLPPPVPIPVPAPLTPLYPAAEILPQPTTASPSRPRTILNRIGRMLNPTPAPTSPLPASSAFNSNDNATNMNNTPGMNRSMTELGAPAPTTMRVAVLIAMPSRPNSTHTHTNSLSGSMSSASATLGSSLSPSLLPPHHAQSAPTPTSVHPLQSQSTAAVPPSSYDDEEQPLPHLEMGVAEVVLLSSDGDVHDELIRERRKRSVGSRGSSEVEA